MSYNNRTTMSRDRLAELRANSGYRSSSTTPMRALPTQPMSSGLPSNPYTQNSRQSTARQSELPSRYRPMTNNYDDYSSPASDYRQTQAYSNYPPNPPSYEMQQKKSFPPMSSQPNSNADDMGQFFDEVEGIKADIQDVNEDILKIDQLHGVILNTIEHNEHERITRQLDSLLAQVKRKNTKLKDRIKAMELSNSKMKPSGDLQIRKTQHSNLKKKFMETIRKFQDIERVHQEKYRNRMERQIRIVKPDASEEEIEAVIDSDNAGQIFAQSVLQSNRSGQARAVLAEVQSRHDEIKKIENTILELHSLFQDMSMLVEQQAEVINEVEQYAEEAAVNIEAGTKEVQVAVTSAQKARTKRKWCFLILVILIIVILIVIYFQVIQPLMYTHDTQSDMLCYNYLSKNECFELSRLDLSTESII
ncbi:uncharacterized protein VTP21DRAFT_11310 [Calcarisporiella thermophila]|uniref:uncharacterized protein n=1 Tax=Calcarisporiella thermophila TaxID=911321 RepID=UPI00374299E9